MRAVWIKMLQSEKPLASAASPTILLNVPIGPMKHLATTLKNRKKSIHILPQ